MDAIKNIISRFGSRPLLLFSPFLLLYIGIVLVFSKDQLTVDEPVYLNFVNNLLNGFYSPAFPNIDLSHAPGYPLFLSLFVAMDIPITGLRLLNAFLLFFSLILFYCLLHKLTSRQWAFLCSVLFGCYWIVYKGLPVIMSETFVYFLVTAIAYVAYLFFKTERNYSGYFFLLVFLIAYLALTRFLFGYVIFISILVWLVAWIITKNQNYKKAFFIVTTSALLTIPYLFYTYSLTGRIFYWTNAGGTTLYWMTTPFSNESGDWFNAELQPNKSIDGSTENASEQLRANHGNDFEKLSYLNSIDRDDAFKRLAIQNIKKYPAKYFQNWVANIGRLLFNYPQSYRKPGMGTLLNFLPNIFVLLLIGVVIATYKKRKPLSFFIQFLLVFISIYFLCSSLLSATIRMFYIIVPVIAIAVSVATYQFSSFLSNRRIKP